jgi:hypothetical protein
MKTTLSLLAGSVQDAKSSPVLGYMKTILRCLLPVSLALCLCGCGPNYAFTPWAGTQENWQTGPAGYTRLVKKVPFFTRAQLPPQPYYVVGAVTTDDEDNVADAVRDQHADAAIIDSETVVRTGSIAWAAPGVYGVSPLTRTTIKATLIKYK